MTPASPATKARAHALARAALAGIATTTSALLTFTACSALHTSHAIQTGSGETSIHIKINEL